MAVTTGAIIELYAQGNGLQASIVIMKLFVEITLGFVCPKELKSNVATIFTVYVPAKLESAVQDDYFILPLASIVML